MAIRLPYQDFDQLQWVHMSLFYYIVLNNTNFKNKTSRYSDVNSFHLRKGQRIILLKYFSKKQKTTGWIDPQNMVHETLQGALHDDSTTMYDTYSFNALV